MRKKLIIILISCLFILSFSAFELKKGKSQKVVLVVADNDFNDMQFTVA